MIEEAWEKGINSQGKVETGGVRMTRKYIGTPEAQALFLSLDIRCEATSVQNHPDLVPHENVLLTVSEYFEDQQATGPDDKVVVTNKAPIYFQHRGHSLTIVGMEVKKDGSANLIVFDPMFHPSSAIKNLVGSNSFRVRDPSKLLKAYRRGDHYLSRYNQFELLL